MNLDYTILIQTDSPFTFDMLEEALPGNWIATMTNTTTGEVWTKRGSIEETSTTAPASFEPVEPLPEMGEWSQG